MESSLARFAFQCASCTITGVRSRQSTHLAAQAPRERGADQSYGLSRFRSRGYPRRLSSIECPTALDIGHARRSR